MCLLYRSSANLKAKVMCRERTPEPDVELIVSLPRLYERDIDVLLQEEFMFNPWVAELFAQVLGLSSDFSVQQCQLSVVDLTGETDIHVAFSVGEGT